MIKGLKDMPLSSKAPNVNIFGLSKRRLRKNLFSVQNYLQREENITNGESTVIYKNTAEVEVKAIHTRNKLEPLSGKISKPGISHRKVRSALDVSF